MIAAIRTLLINAPAVAAIVGTDIYGPDTPDPVPYPCIRLHRVSDTRGYRVIRGPRLQVSCWAETYAEVRELADAVIALLDGYAGVHDGVLLEGIVFLNGPEFFERETRLHHIPCDFRVTYRES